MQFTLAIAALIASASAATTGTAKVVNRCSYDVHVWSIDKQLGCSSDAGTVLKKGESYSEAFQNGTDGGISIKLSKYSTCGGHDLSQLEYKLDYSSDYAGNYLDMSFVDCAGGDCPGWNDGFYLVAGNTDVATASSTNNEFCPILKAASSIEAAKVAYVNPDDRQTKYCLTNAPLELYLCGSEAPGASDIAAASSAVVSTTVSASSSPAQPTTSQVASAPATSDVAVQAAAAPTEAEVNAAAAAVTPTVSEVKAAAAPVTTPAPEAPKAVKTVVTYVTAYVDAPVKRHSHGRRHQHFNA
ncbi:hypothetical protein P280DRAFT_106790 [Massarina eburnea CBS 473.64]|uniref:Uncharacterized protein n=1 Tax=Massarina eburnea CBS 473.64 TaxID=1395130 RepID=A0A6A6RQV2_9PLEO|nr:hypothetical protein P280DRAFT_106790 [Massarina eburnea CBS 473.64]